MMGSRCRNGIRRGRRAERGGAGARVRRGAAGSAGEGGGDGSPLPGPGRLRGRGGFSIVELVVAMIILTVGLLGLAAGTGYVIRSSETGRVDTERAQARQSVVELLRAQDFDDLGPGDIEIGPYQAEWELVLDSENSRILEITLTGPGRGARGAQAGVEETFQYRVNRSGMVDP